jgi:hypothetical protein
MAKISFPANPTTTDAAAEKLFKITIKHPLLIKGLEISAEVIKAEVKNTVEDMKDILDDLDDE